MAALNAEIPPELKKAFEKACTDRDKTLKVAVAEALAEWIEDERAKEKPRPVASPIAPDGRDGPATLGVPRSEWHRMLDQVLDTRVTNPLVINIVTNLLAYGYDAVAISKGHFRKYEVETRVLRELTAELLGTQQVEELADLAAFMANASPGDLDLVKRLMESTKAKEAKDAPHQTAAPREERPRKRAGNGR